MKKILFQQAHFLCSALNTSELPSLKGPNGEALPEIALVGRSNAGKSSFLNALLQSKSIAKTSSTPGKTQRINFFLVDEFFLLVDLPGYGYAKAPKRQIASWSCAIDNYLNHRSHLKALLLMLDIRRNPSQEDLALIAWALSKDISLFAIFTKSDKLSDAQVAQSIQTHLATIHRACSESKHTIAGFMAISNIKFYARAHFLQLINQENIWD